MHPLKERKEKELDINLCLNEISEAFFNKHLKGSLDIEFISSRTDNNIWCSKYRDNDDHVFIYAGNNYPNIECFAHEMLHLYLFLHGFGTWGPSSYGFYQKLNRNLVESQQIIDGISNAIAHKKMLPIYLDELKMDKTKFFSSWDRLVDDKRIASLYDMFHNNSSVKKYHFTEFIRIYYNVPQI